MQLHVTCRRPHYWPPQADATLPLYANTSRGSRLTPQSWAYNSCLMWFGARHKFVALLDADEFLVIKPPAAAGASDAAAAAKPFARPNITAFLQPFEGARTTAALPLVHMPPAYLHTTAPAVNDRSHGTHIAYGTPQDRCIQPFRLWLCLRQRSPSHCAVPAARMSCTSQI
jgi:hypothetical protein